MTTPDQFSLKTWDAEFCNKNLLISVSMEWTSVVALHFVGLVSAVCLYHYNDSWFKSAIPPGTNPQNSTINASIGALAQLEVGNTLSWLLVIVSSGYLVYLLYKVYDAVFGTTSIINTPSDRDVGYIVTPGRSKRDIANMVRRRRRVGDIPPPYPNGWYEIMRSKDLPVGVSKAVNLIGQHFAVFRRENGHVTIMDAYCPHLGANLGVGGVVRGNCIECPFHGWQFDGDTGQCTSIPYADKVPSFAKTKVWPSLEINGFIFLWYDVDGKEPWFYPENLVDQNKRWIYKGYTYHLINAHCQVR